MIFLKSLELWVSVEILRHVASRCEFSEGGQVTPSPYPQPSPPPHPPHSSLISSVPPPSPPGLCVEWRHPTHTTSVARLPGRNSGQKAQKGPQKKKFLAEFWLILPKTGRKGATENFQKKFLIFICDNCDKFDF